MLYIASFIYHITNIPPLSHYSCTLDIIRIKPQIRALSSRSSIVFVTTHKCMTSWIGPLGTTTGTQKLFSAALGQWAVLQTQFMCNLRDTGGWD